MISVILTGTSPPPTMNEASVSALHLPAVIVRALTCVPSLRMTPFAESYFFAEAEIEPAKRTRGSDSSVV